jgi:lysozyme family protein
MAPSSSTDIDALITEVEHKEGDDKVTNDPADKGGRTQYGISEKSFPKAWEDGKVTEQEARDIYLNTFVIGPGFSRIPASHSKVQTILIDWGVNSGPAIAIQHLQRLLMLPVDGVCGPGTLGALSAADPSLLAAKLVRERVKMIGRVVQKNPSQLKFLGGWLDRALSFLG